MRSRRDFFSMLAGLAVCPLFGRESRYAGSTEGHNYTFHYRNFIQDDVVSTRNVWKPNTLYKTGDRIVITGATKPITWDEYGRTFEWQYEPGAVTWRSV